MPKATGWIDQYPHKPDAGDEYYFVRRKDRNDVVIMGFSMGKAWLNGVAYEQSEMRSHLFLGPLKPEDFEQLAALREGIERLIIDAGFTLSTPGFVRGRDELAKSVAALREALGKGEQS